jgi:hypothetical protein
MPICIIMYPMCLVGFIPVTLAISLWLIHHPAVERHGIQNSGVLNSGRRSSDRHNWVYDDDDYWHTLFPWIGLRENLNRKPWFLPSNIGISGSNFPIIQFYDYDTSLCININYYHYYYYYY